MRIALVHRDLHQRTRGGICTVYRALAREMVARGHDVRLITQATPDPPRVPGATVIELPRTNDLAAHRATVADTLRRLGPDIVECSTWEAEALAYLNHGRRAPVLVRGEFSAATMGATGLVDAEHALVRLADDVIAVSRFAGNDLSSAYGMPAPDVVANGIDRQRFTPGPATMPTSGQRVTLDSDGRPTQPEQLPDLLHEGQHVPPFTPDPHNRVNLVWVGKITPMKGWDRLETIADELSDIASITVLLGHSAAFCPVTSAAKLLTMLHDLDDHDVPGFYRSADWLLSTSRWEGFGLAIAEAIACGTPALLPHELGTGPELLAAGGGYSYTDTADLCRLLRDAPRPSVAVPADFDWGINAEQTLAHYRALVGR